MEPRWRPALIYQDLAFEKYGILHLDSSYRIAFVDGTSMSEATILSWPGGAVSYGESVDLSINLVAPIYPGSYQGNYMLLAPDGTYLVWALRTKRFG